MSAPDAPPGPPEYGPLVAILLDNPEMLGRLNELHTDDGRGWCRTCGGPQSGRHRMPCDLRRSIDRAFVVRYEAWEAQGQR